MELDHCQRKIVLQDQFEKICFKYQIFLRGHAINACIAFEIFLAQQFF